MRLMGLDYGSKTVGVAVSDPLGLTAQGVETVWRKQENKLRQTMARIEELISEYQVVPAVLLQGKARLLRRKNRECVRKRVISHSFSSRSCIQGCCIERCGGLFCTFFGSRCGESARASMSRFRLIYQRVHFLHY